MKRLISRIFCENWTTKNINVIFVSLIAELQEKGNRIQLKVGPEVQPKEFMISVKKKLIHPFEREINRKARKIRISLEK